MLNVQFVPRIDAVDAVAVSDKKERVGLLTDRLIFHGQCVAAFVKLLNSGKARGDINLDLRKALSPAIDFHLSKLYIVHLQIKALKNKP